MILTIKTKDLKTALENLTAVIDKKASIPALRMVKATTTEKGVELVATDCDQLLKINLACEVSGAWLLL